MNIPAILLKPPIARAAYSDRTAWLMSELSRLAYISFEINEKEIQKLKKELQLFEFNLVETFNSDGSQAYIAQKLDASMTVLVFRGTEKDWRDIKADLRANFKEHKGSKIHNGFLNSFLKIEGFITRTLNRLNPKSLYITGHSLGGAMALVATHHYNSDNIAACYTFGSPRVGRVDFGYKIKSPIYRVINRVDIVTRQPPIWLIEIILMFLWIPYIRGFFKTKFHGYTHHGDVRFISYQQKNIADIFLLSNPSFFQRVLVWLKIVPKGPKFLADDHRISGYCNQLKGYALSRCC